MTCYGSKEYEGESIETPDDNCPDCGNPTHDGSSIDSCGYSPVSCDTCGHRECDHSC